MNTVTLMTYLSAQMLGQATFGSMTECLSARDVVLKQQNDLRAYCVYAKKKVEVNPETFFKAFGEMVGKIQESPK